MEATLHQNLLTWYNRQKRDLPWRKNKDPYRIWISEIMLQQTRVETVIPYYERFLAKYPNVKSLAAAKEDDLTNLWAGLGYYSRVRNLHFAAKQVCEIFSGTLPRTLADLRSLKGIGPYTAAAISSMAYDLPFAAVDGNLERVLARVLALKENPKKEGYEKVASAAQRLVEMGHPGDLNQALMDLSATICLPKNPRCLICPIQKICRANKLGLTNEIPLKEKKQASIELNSKGLVLFYGHGKSTEILLTRRAKGQWLSGMWDIPWWIANDTLQATKDWKKIGEHKANRSITKHKILFHVDFYALKTKPSNAQLARMLAQISSEQKWQKLAALAEINLPRPSQKALQVALKALD